MARGPEENPQLGHLRRIAKLARPRPGEPWSIRHALEELEPEERALVPEALRQYRGRMAPLIDAEPRLDGEGARLVRESFKPMGAKMRPDMSEEQGAAWAAAIVLAFSDFPPWCTAKALAEAMHTAWQFPTDMELGVRKIAQRILEEHRDCLRRIREMMEALERAARPPQPQLEDQRGEPLSFDEAMALARGPHGKSLLAMGLKLGSICQEHHDRILRQLLEEAEAKAE